MSLTMVAPAFSAASATTAHVVSIDIGRSTASRTASTTGTTRDFSTSTGVGSAPGRDDAPPISITSMPQASKLLANATALSS